MSRKQAVGSLCGPMWHQSTILLLFCAFFISTTPTTIFAEEVIKIGYFNLAPHAFVKEGRGLPVGAGIDYWEHYLAPEMGVKVQWIGPSNIKRLTLEAQAEKIDAILVFAKNPQRLKIFDFPENNYTQMISGIALRLDHPMDTVSSIEDLEEIKLGFQVDAIIPPPLRKDFIQWEWIYGAQWQKSGFGMLFRNRIGAVFDAMSSSLEYQARILGYKNKIKILTIPGTQLKNYTAFPKSGKGHFLNKYNDAHNKFRHTVSYDELVKKYLDEFPD